jgi:hypothetical protein
MLRPELVPAFMINITAEVAPAPGASDSGSSSATTAEVLPKASAEVQVSTDAGAGANANANASASASSVAAANVTGSAELYKQQAQVAEQCAAAATLAACNEQRFALQPSLLQAAASFELNPKPLMVVCFDGVAGEGAGQVGRNAVGSTVAGTTVAGSTVAGNTVAGNATSTTKSGNSGASARLGLLAAAAAGLALALPL